MGYFKIKLNKNHRFIIIFLLFVLVISLPIMIIYNYNFKTNIKKSNTFDKIVKDLNIINNSFKEFSTEFVVNNESIVNNLRHNIESLEKIKNDLRSLVIIDDYSRETSSKILSSIESAQNLYNNCISSLEYQNIASTSDYVTKINEQQFDLMKIYADLNYLGIQINFNDDSLVFFDKLINYLNTLEVISKKNNVNTAQSELFIKNFKTAVDELSELAQDLEPAILKIREDNRPFDTILKDLDDKECKYLNIKHSINSISIPEGYLSYYNSIVDTFNLYSNYLKTIKVAIIFEKSSADYDDNKEIIDKNYKNAFSKFDDFSDSLTSLKKSLENF